MAVSGAGGWTPSSLVCISNRRLTALGTTHNTPPELAAKDMDEVAAKLMASPERTPVRIDARGMNFYKLNLMLMASGAVEAEI